MSLIAEKRTFDSRPYDFICIKLLAPGETISSVVSVLGDQGQLVFGAGQINTQAITYDSGVVAPIGTVVQVPISGGTIGVADSMNLDYPNLLCTVRVRFITSLGNKLEATALILLKDQIDPASA